MSLDTEAREADSTNLEVGVTAGCRRQSDDAAIGPPYAGPPSADHAGDYAEEVKKKLAQKMVVRGPRGEVREIWVDSMELSPDSTLNQVHIRFHMEQVDAVMQKSVPREANGSVHTSLFFTFSGNVSLHANFAALKGFAKARGFRQRITPLRDQNA